MQVKQQAEEKELRENSKAAGDLLQSGERYRVFLRIPLTDEYSGLISSWNGSDQCAACLICSVDG